MATQYAFDLVDTLAEKIRHARAVVQLVSMAKLGDYATGIDGLVEDSMGLADALLSEAADAVASLPQGRAA